MSENSSNDERSALGDDGGVGGLIGGYVCGWGINSSLQMESSVSLSTACTVFLTFSA